MTCHNMKKSWKEKDGKGKKMLFTILVFIYLLQKSLNIYLINVEKKFKIKNHQSPTGLISIRIPLPECKRTLMYYLYILNCINKWYVIIFILLSYFCFNFVFKLPISDRPHQHQNSTARVQEDSSHDMCATSQRCCYYCGRADIVQIFM